MATVQELIAKVSVQGTGAFQRDMRAMERDAQQFASKATGAGRDLLAMFGKIGSAVTGTAGILGAAAGMGGIAAFGAAAVKASADWEQLGVTLRMLSDSGAEAQGKLKFIRDLAIPATATTDQLARAGVELEGFKVRLEKALPIVAKLQAAFQFDPLALEKATSIIGRLSQGQMPDIELLSGMGLNRRQFADQGIQFDPNGKLLSSATETLDALDRIVQAKYGGILEAVAGTTNSKLATLQDRWQESMRRIGAVITKTLIPVIEYLSTVLDNLAKSGTLERWARGVMEFIKHIGDAISILGAHISLVAVLVYAAFQQWTKALIAGLAGVAAYVGGQMLQGKIDGILKEIDKAGKAGGAPAGIPKDPNPGKGWGDITSDPVQTAIERNTRRTADNTAPDLRRFALGGGPLGAMGITPVELAAVRSGGSGRVTVELRGSDTFESMLADAINDTVTSMKRQGIL